MRIFLSTIALSASVFVEAATDDVKLIDVTDAQMNGAKATARRTLDQFLSLRANPPTGAEHFSVKVRFTHRDNAELMWVGPFRSSLNGFEGVLKNQPRDIPTLTWGQQVKFSKEDIVDWGYSQEGKTYGNFTTCVLFDRNPSPVSLKAKSERGFVCDATGKNLGIKSK